LMSAILDCVTEFGSMEAEDLVAAVSRRLGFKRTGPRIRDRVAQTVNELAHSEKLIVTNLGRVRLAQPPGP
jgi:hypothetical protein